MNNVAQLPTPPSSSSALSGTARAIAIPVTDEKQTTPLGFLLALLLSLSLFLVGLTGCVTIHNDVASSDAGTGATTARYASLGQTGASCRCGMNSSIGTVAAACPCSTGGVLGQPSYVYQPNYGQAYGNGQPMVYQNGANDPAGSGYPAGTNGSMYGYPSDGNGNVQIVYVPVERVVENNEVYYREVVQAPVEQTEQISSEERIINAIGAGVGVMQDIYNRSRQGERNENGSNGNVRRGNGGGTMGQVGGYDERNDGWGRREEDRQNGGIPVRDSAVAVNGRENHLPVESAPTRSSGMGGASNSSGLGTSAGSRNSGSRGVTGIDRNGAAPMGNPDQQRDTLKDRTTTVQNDRRVGGSSMPINSGQIGTATPADRSPNTSSTQTSGSSRSTPNLSGSTSATNQNSSNGSNGELGRSSSSTPTRQSGTGTPNPNVTTPATPSRSTSSSVPTPTTRETNGTSSSTPTAPVSNSRPVNSSPVTTAPTTVTAVGESTKEEKKIEAPSIGTQNGTRVVNPGTIGTGPVESTEAPIESTPVPNVSGGMVVPSNGGLQPQSN